VRRSVARRNCHRTPFGGRASARAASGREVDGIARLASRPDPWFERTLRRVDGPGARRTRRYRGAAVVAARGTCFGTGNGLARLVEVAGAGRPNVHVIACRTSVWRADGGRTACHLKERPRQTCRRTGFGPRGSRRAVVERLDRRPGSPTVPIPRFGAAAGSAGGPERRLAGRQRSGSVANELRLGRRQARSAVEVERPASQWSAPGAASHFGEARPAGTTGSSPAGAAAGAPRSRRASARRR
jgi:hypothetical protein